MRKHHGALADREGWVERELHVPPRILVVEDEPELRAALLRFLAAYDCEISEAGTAHDALEAAQQHTPGLIILDFGLPDMNGFELIRRFRMKHEHASVPMLMLSGTPRAFDLHETFACDLSGLVKKPASADLMYEEICRALGGRLKRRDGSSLESGASFGSAAAAAEAELKSLLDAETRECEVEADNLPDSHDQAAADAAPVIKLVNAIMSLAMDKKASDIHIEPQERVVRVRLRIDGALVPQLEVPLSMGPAVVARLKVMAHLDIAERRVPQDGRFRMRLPDGRKVEVRLSTLPSRHGEKVVMRLLGMASVQKDLNSLKCHPRDLECLRSALANPNGLILVTGPTGSGKTTTLYTMLAALNTPERNIVTVEDPVEYEIPGITQVNARPEVGLTFDKALRAFLRQDPDVILVGEIRDAETANIALKAAATGHLVMSTLHTNDAVSAVTRLVDMGIPPYLVAAAVRLVVSQRLVRTLCMHCRKPAALPEHQRRFLLGDEALRLSAVYEPSGCRACDNTGYSGRTSVMEVLPVRSSVMREAIVHCASEDSLRSQSLSDGLRPLRTGALSLVEKGVTSLAEALKLVVAE